MLKKAVDKFSQMDELSIKGIPFFFVIDFLANDIRIHRIEELEKENIWVDFPKFKNQNIKKEIQKDFVWKPFPETLEEYQKGFDLIQESQKKGECLLANYTRKTKIETDLTLEQIFHLSEAKYKVKYKDNWLFFSPETFVEIEGEKILTYPMKGTIDASIENAAQKLRESKKEKEEHRTAVDLLKKDLENIADNVSVDEFQRIDYLKTQNKNLYAMSSQLSGTVKQQFKEKIGSLLEKLLPAGSILGEPREKTLQITLEAEGYDRGFYTGICGYYDGKNLDSCVMIRFVEKENDEFYYKSGGGITHQSVLEDEYQEMKNKIYVPIY